ncbi:MAG: HEAT repeat domain-containing protein [Pedobacter sp.]|nr:MAG: HEAT repeat domain-containing protein [Pedobacter sp.]
MLHLTIMDKKLKTELEELKKDIFSNEWETVKSAGNRLGKIGGTEVVNFLISLLNLDNSSIRNTAALALEEIKDNRAVEPLLNSIFKKENHNYNGTMVFALKSLNCSGYVTDIFKILFYEIYEAKLSAYAILNDQIFEFTEAEIREVQKIWADCKLNPKDCEGYEDEKIREMMEDAFEGYIGYLDDEAMIDNF